MCFADDRSQEARRCCRFVSCKLIHFQFEVLGKKFAQYNRLLMEPPRKHSLPEKRRKLVRPFNHPVSVIPRHLGVGGVGRRRLNGFFDIDKTKPFVLALRPANSNQNCKPKAAKRTAALHPISKVQNPHFIVRIAPLERSNQATHFWGIEDPVNLPFFARGRGPETSAERDGWGYVFDPVFSQMTPFALQRSFQNTT